MYEAIDPRGDTPEPSFEQELSSLLNKHSWDTRVNAPDFILADHLAGELRNLAALNDRNKEWHAVEANPEPLVKQHRLAKPGKLNRPRWEFARITPHIMTPTHPNQGVIMSKLNTALAYLKENKEVIGKKALILGGTAAGALIVDGFAFRTKTVTEITTTEEIIEDDKTTTKTTEVKIEE